MNGGLPPNVLAFIQEFLKTQYEVTLAQGREELDAEGFAKEAAKLDAFYRQGLSAGVRRSRQPGESNFPDFAEVLKGKAVRTLFLIRAYDHSELGLIYRFYVGTDRPKGKKYFHSYYIAVQDGTFKIIAQYLINERHTGWEWSQGDRSTKYPLNFRGIWRFEEPNHEKDKEDYDSEAGIDYDTVGGQPTAAMPYDGGAVPRPAAKCAVEPFGRVQEDAAANTYFASGLRLLMGRFFTHGFFRDGTDPFVSSLPWPELGKAVQFSRELVDILREGACTALESEGDAAYFPFVYCGDMLLDGLPDFAANDDVPQGAKVKYDTLEDRDCLFWYDDFAEDVEADLDANTVEAFRKVHSKMCASLNDIVEFSVKAGTEFPVVIGGTFTPGIFAGVITKRVQT